MVSVAIPICWQVLKSESSAAKVKRIAGLVLVGVEYGISKLDGIFPRCG
jgi:hypothetical protein